MILLIIMTVGDTVDYQMILLIVMTIDDPIGYHDY